MSGKEIRMRRLFPDGRRRLFAVPLDHAVSMGPIDGLEASRPLAASLVESGVDLLVLPKGVVRDVAPVLGARCLLAVHLSASTSMGPAPDAKVLVGTPAEAVALGADLVSVQVNFGVPEEGAMLRDLGVTVDACRALGLPLLCMAYVKGRPSVSAAELQHAARAVADLGADLVKTSHPGTLEGLQAMVRTTPVPLLLSGGLRSDDPDAFLLLVRDAMTAGAAGVCAGRNLFQRRPIEPWARRIAGLLHGTGAAA
jgi:DhnA family fructose-bisphosphate aldolase class Ia